MESTINVHATGEAEIASNLTPKFGTGSLPVVGMTSASCVGRIAKALNRVEGVGKATVNQEPAQEAGGVPSISGTTGS